LENQSFSLKKFLFGSINKKLIITFALTGFIILVLGFIGLSFIEQNVKSEVFNHIISLAELREVQIFQYLDSINSRTIDFSSDGFIRTSLKYIVIDNSPADVEKLNNYLINNKMPLDSTLAGILIINNKGIIVASTDEEEIGKDESKDDYFIKGKEGIFTIELREHPHFEFQNIFVVSAPLTDVETGELLGVIVNFFDVGEIEDIFSGKFQLEKEALTGTTDLGNGMETYIVNRDGIMFVHSAVYRERHSGGMIVDTIPVKKCFEEGKEFSGTYIDYAGEEVVGASRCIPDIKWVLLVESSTKETFAFINKIFFIFIFLAIVFIIFIIFLWYILNEKISRPITQLRSAAEDLEKGNFNTKVNIKTGDELEELGKSFNKTSEALGRLEDEHKQIDKAKTEFLSITSHELRSPMTPMKAQLQMLLKEYFGKLTKEQKESLEIVERNTTRLDKIIMDFLEISRIEAARLKFNFIKADIIPYIKRLIAEMDGFMPEKKIKIELKIEKLPAIESDPDRIMQVLRNLINNAKKFSPSNSKIFIEAKLKGSMILFSVKDQGIGMSNEDQLRMFEPFFQAEQTIYREYSGVGLGLAICKGIVESQNGKIWIESEPGKGSTFYFTVPLEPVKEMKSISLLFSSKQDIENKIIKFFKEFLGPIGEIEFEKLREAKEVTKEKLFIYLNSISDKGIINKEEAEILKSKIGQIFEGKIKGGEMEDSLKETVEKFFKINSNKK